MRPCQHGRLTRKEAVTEAPRVKAIVVGLLQRFGFSLTVAEIHVDRFPMIEIVGNRGVDIGKAKRRIRGDDRFRRLPALVGINDEIEDHTRTPNARDTVLVDPNRGLQRLQVESRHRRMVP